MVFLFFQKKFQCTFFALLALCGTAWAGVVQADSNKNNEALNAALAAASEMKLSHERQWKLILYYYQSWRGERTLIDDDFFFDAQGGLNPEAELNATLRALFEVPLNTPEKESPQCRFPMRTSWLVRKLAARNIVVPQRKCEEFDKFVAAVEPVGVTLLFSSFYPNNPGSLFGHTFLRVNSKSSLANKGSSNLLDLGVGFAAFPTTNNALVYVLAGLFGGFPGRFDLTPFYIKVQEYNHSENRDLWEYDLNYSPDQVTDMLRSLYEARAANIDYYYFDDNCAYMLLHLLEVARPEFDLKGKFNSWIIPGDTLRVVATEPGLVNEIRYRPSVFRSFQLLHKELTALENEMLEKLVAKKLSAAALELPTPRKILLLDTFLEFIDFDERLAGSKEAVKWAQPRKEALLARARLGQQLIQEKESYVSPLAAITMPQNERPEREHPPTRLSFGLGITQQRKGFLELQWRPALHDLGSRQAGYSRELEIQFFQPAVRVYQDTKKLEFHEFHLLRILAANAVTPLVNQRAWAFNLSLDQTLGKFRYRKYLQVGVGKATSFGGSESRLYGMAVVDGGHEKQLGWHAGPGALLGLVVPFAEETKMRVDAKWVRHFGMKRTESNLVLRGQLTQSFGPNYELNLVGERTNTLNAVSVMLHTYF